MEKYTGPIDGETLEAVKKASKHEKFIEIFDTHFNKAFQVQSERRKNKEKVPGP